MQSRIGTWIRVQEFGKASPSTQYGNSASAPCNFDAILFRKPARLFRIDPRHSWLLNQANAKPSTNSIGNVGQLAIDLMISTYKARHVGFLYSAHLEPCVGLNAFGQDGLSTNMDVYQSERFTFVQIRSPVVKVGNCLTDLKGQGIKFSRDLVRWIVDCGFDFVVMPSGADASRRIDSQLSGEPIRYIESKTFKKSALKKLAEFERLESRSTDMIAEGFSEFEIRNLAPELLPVGGDGIAKYVYKFCQDSDVQLLVLLRFTIEGDNFNDSVQFAKRIDELVEIGGKDLIVPESWKHMYGQLRHAEEIFQ